MHDSYWRFHRDQFLSLLPPPGALTLDVGAGEGRLARDLRARGHQVIALDLSQALAVAARQADASMGVLVADAAALPLPDQVADLVLAFMSLQDLDDLQGAVREAARVLEPGGRLCIAIVHPLNSAGQFAGDDPGSPFVIEGSYLRTAHYADEIERDGLRMTFAGIHRPLERYIAALGDAGFLIERLREPSVLGDAVRRPRQERWQRIPLFLHIRAVRT